MIVLKHNEMNCCLKLSSHSGVSLNYNLKKNLMAALNSDMLIFCLYKICKKFLDLTFCNRAEHCPLTLTSCMHVWMHTNTSGETPACFLLSSCPPYCSSLHAGSFLPLSPSCWRCPADVPLIIRTYITPTLKTMSFESVY